MVPTCNVWITIDVSNGKSSVFQYYLCVCVFQACVCSQAKTEHELFFEIRAEILDLKNKVQARTLSVCDR